MYNRGSYSSATSNSSKAQTFTIESQHFKKENLLLNFLVNINTSAHQTKPHFSVISFTQSSKETVLCAVKTSYNIAILKIENKKFSLMHQLEIAEKLTNREYIFCFEFCDRSVEKKKERNLLIGYNTGLILLVDFFNSEILARFNYNEKTRETVRQSSVLKIFMSPWNPTRFYAVYQDGVILSYDLKRKAGANTRFLDKFRKVEAKYRLKDSQSSALMKTSTINSVKGSRQGSQQSINMNSQYYKIKRKPEYNLTVKYYPDAQEFNSIFLENNNSLQESNPDTFIKLNCNTIADVMLISDSFFIKIGAKPIIESGVETSYVLAYAGLDGYFRIMDFREREPLLSFKTYYGGINALAFSKNYELVAISGHDDRCIILNLSNKCYINLQGHNSFIARSVIQELDKDILRVIVGSVDSYLSFTEFNRNLLYNPEKKDNAEKGLTDGIKKGITHNNKCFYQIVFKEKVGEHLQATNLKQINNEGIAWLYLLDGFLVTSCYDGCVSAWSIEDKEEPEPENAKKEEISETNHEHEVINKPTLAEKKKEDLNQESPNHFGAPNSSPDKKNEEEAKEKGIIKDEPSGESTGVDEKKLGLSSHEEKVKHDEQNKENQPIIDESDNPYKDTKKYISSQVEPKD